MRLVRLPSDDRQLVSRAMAGRSADADELIRRLMPVIHARIRRWQRRAGRSSAFDTEDLVQEIWLKLIDAGGRRLLAYDPSLGASLEGYVGLLTERELGKIVRASNAQKRRAALESFSFKERELAADDPTPEAEAAARDLAARLSDHLELHLPARGKLVLRYAFIDELPPARIAQILGVTVQVVYNWLHRIRTTARAFLGSA